MIKPVIMLGAGGHGRVLAEAVLHRGGTIVGLCVPAKDRDSRLLKDIPILGDDADVGRLDPGAFELVNAIGVKPKSGDPGTGQRERIFREFSTKGFSFARVIGAGTVIASDVQIGVGAQILGGAIIQPGVEIGENAVITLGTAIDHDSKIGAHAFIGPGVTFCGAVKIGDGAFLGAGVVVLPGVSIGRRAVVGAGVLVRRNVSDGEVLLS
jgi:sugar O-acyltransferase (sialic acid O-acetyltransferase NeuD family)